MGLYHRSLVLGYGPPTRVAWVMTFRAIALLIICCATLSLATNTNGQTVYRYPAYPPPMANTGGVIVVGGAGAGAISTTEYFDHYHGLYQRIYPGALPVVRQAPLAPPPAAVQSGAPPPITASPETETASKTAAAPPPSAQDDIPVPVEESWSFKLTPFLWLPSIETNIGAGAVPTDMDATADGSSGIFGFDFGFLLMAEARRGRFGVLGDIGYIAVSTDGESPGTHSSMSKLEQMAPSARWGPSIRPPSGAD